ALAAALALEQHIDVDQPLRRPRYPEYLADPRTHLDGDFAKRFAALEPVSAASFVEVKKRAPVPPHPERDLLWFVANYAPEMESWERDIFLAVREESFYFYPVFASQTLHEAILAPKYNFGAPIVSASHVRNDGTLELTHDSATDARGLDLERSRKVLDYLQRVWRRPIVLTTVNQAGSALELTAP